MPDLTVEYYWVCKQLSDHFSRYPNYVLDGKPNPPCTWDQFTHGGNPINGRCPMCGGEVTSHGVGV